MAENIIYINGEPVKLIPLGECACGCGGDTPPSKKKNPYKFIKGHHWRLIKGPFHHAWKGGKTLYANGYYFVLAHGHPRANCRGYVREHILIIEKLLDKPLPPKAVIHHHTPDQLVACENQAYHMLLHQRMKAYKECGHANWLKCRYCHQWDDPINMYIHKKKRIGYHRKCHAVYELNRTYRKKAL